MKTEIMGLNEEIEMSVRADWEIRKNIRTVL